MHVGGKKKMSWGRKASTPPACAAEQSVAAGRPTRHKQIATAGHPVLYAHCQEPQTTATTHFLVVRKNTKKIRLSPARGRGFGFYGPLPRPRKAGNLACLQRYALHALNPHRNHSTGPEIFPQPLYPQGIGQPNAYKTLDILRVFAFKCRESPKAPTPARGRERKRDMWAGSNAAIKRRTVGFFPFLVLTGLCGSFSSLLIWLIAVETNAALWVPLAQPRPWDWQAETWSHLVPMLTALIIAPAISSLIIGAHTPYQGGLIGFTASLFDLLPFYAGGVGTAGDGAEVAPALLAAFLGGAILAFYLGDLGSWLYRCRWRRETQAREIVALQADAV